ncbi:arylsulfotransferase family protein [Hartmannibacter diazotrophicus]|uniref:arylsulfotransferase family protein n=1 Tax=Hartmannibacter diazotrophicus TaxID=1482074 RepID=UPI0012FD4767|nr:arylsulfotransferase family protein [Hartmannibacter diazotrophicus]
MTVAGFPTKAKYVLREIYGFASGNYKDEQIRVLRDPTADYTGFTPIRSAPGIDLPGLVIKADPARMTKGWRIAIGAFGLDGDVQNAALLISPDLEVVRMWTLDEIPIGDKDPEPRYRVFPHGVDVLKDGSLVYAFDGGMSLQRQDACGHRMWAVRGHYNHTVNLDDTQETVWTLGDLVTLTQVSVKDGSVVREITMDEIIEKNPMIDILEVRKLHGNYLGDNERNTSGKWMEEPHHLNDVDPLPAAYADKFKDLGFEAGDLLISSRSLNLIFVVDPDTLKIKWWRVGVTQRQHDPDWLADGTIMAFNNRMSRDFSEVLDIDPRTFKTKVLFDGSKHDFYSRIRGKIEMLDNGTLVVTSPQQARAFEVDANGDTVFEMANLKPGSDTLNYTLSEMKWFPMDYFKEDTWKCE